jgi:hypothetical protein
VSNWTWPTEDTCLQWALEAGSAMFEKAKTVLEHLDLLAKYLGLACQVNIF